MTDAREANEPGIDADLRFHRGILAASRNPLLLQMGNLISVGLYISHRFSKESFALFLPMHGEVMEAISARRPADARAAMQRLLSQTRDYMKDHIRE
jgi:DNA-binding FadR family transcriptional regulator